MSILIGILSLYFTFTIYFIVKEIRSKFKKQEKKDKWLKFEKEKPKEDEYFLFKYGKDNSSFALGTWKEEENLPWHQNIKTLNINTGKLEKLITPPTHFSLIKT